MTEHMDLDRFEALAMTHGPDLATWPAEVRADAAALLAGSVAARELLGEGASVFDDLKIAAMAPEPAPDALMARVLADAAVVAPAPVATPRPARRGGGFRWLLRLAPPTALAASAALGILLGYSAPESYVSSAFGSGDEELWTEMVTLADEPGLFGDIDVGDLE